MSLVEVRADVGAAALDEVPGQRARGLRRSRSTARRLGVEQPEQVPEGVLLAAVRGRRDQDQVPVGVGGQRCDELVRGVGPAAGRRRTRRCAPRRRSPAPGRCAEVARGPVDLMKSVETTMCRIPLEDRLAEQQSALEPRTCRAAPARRRCGTSRAARLPLLGEGGRHSTASRCASPGRAARRRSGRPRSSCRCRRRRRSAAAPGPASAPSAAARAGRRAARRRAWRATGTGRRWSGTRSAARAQQRGALPCRRRRVWGRERRRA